MRRAAVLSLAAAAVASPQNSTYLAAVQEWFANGAAVGRNATAPRADWEVVRPGGRTSCAFGTEWAFFVRRGRGDGARKLVFEFEGGGACWNAATCNAGATYYTEVDVDAKLRMLALGGIHEDAARNPFDGWNHVFVPYCTGDIHVGDRVHDYGQRTVHHVGHVNMRAAVAWALEHLPTDPTEVVATGCSAGSLGAVINGPIAFQQYPAARHAVWGDAAWGIVTETMYNQAYPNWDWHYDPTNPRLSPEEASRWRPLMGAYVVESSAAHRPATRFSMYTTNADAVQTGFYLLGGGNPLAWTRELRAEVAAVHARGLGVGTYISPGVGHCASQDGIFYSTSVEGASLNDWVRSVIDGREFRHNIDCLSDGTCSA